MKTTRNRSGNAKVNEAEAGLRQNERCSYPTCRPNARRAEHADPAGVRGVKPFEGLNRRGLARAIRPQNGDDFPGIDGERNPIDRVHVAVGLVQVDNFDHRRHGHRQ